MKIYRGVLGFMMSLFIHAASTAADDVGSYLQKSSSVNLVDAQHVQVCVNRAVKNICSIHKLPASARSVTRIIPGDFIALSTASWLAVAGDQVSLCAVSLDRRKTQCSAFAGVSSENLAIAYQSEGDTARLLVSSAATAGRTASASQNDAIRFKESLSTIRATLGASINSGICAPEGSGSQDVEECDWGNEPEPDPCANGCQVVEIPGTPPSDPPFYPGGQIGGDNPPILPGTGPDETGPLAQCMHNAYIAWEKMDLICKAAPTMRDRLVCEEVNMRLYNEEREYCTKEHGG